MALSILIPYLPIIMAFLALELIDVFPLQSFNFDRIHYSNNPYPWDAILFVPSSEINFTYMNSVYVPIITVIPIFWFFGKTKEALNMYRRCLVTVGLGRFFPNLNEEYDPDRRKGASGGSQSWQIRSSGQQSQV
jgi:pheromone a factor receptor